jgi:hypothetical protein
LAPRGPHETEIESTDLFEAFASLIKEKLVCIFSAPVAERMKKQTQEKKNGIKKLRNKNYKN